MILILLFSLMMSSVTFAQDMLQAFSGDTFKTRIEAENLSAFGSDSLSNRNLSIQHALYHEGKNFLTGGAKWQTLNFKNNDKGLKDYDNIQGSLTYKRLLEDNKFWSANVSYGSASDEPFKNGRDGAIGATFIKKQSQRWMWLVNYSNNRSFLNNIPIPGFVYFHTMSKQKALVIGFPFVYWVNPLSQNWSLRYFGLLPWAHRVRLVWVGTDGIEPYLGFEQGPLTYFDSRRTDRQDRTFWFERKTQLGLEGKLIGNIGYDLQGGLAFDRTLYEAKNFGNKKNSSRFFQKAPYVSLSLKFNF